MASHDRRRSSSSQFTKRDDYLGDSEQRDRNSSAQIRSDSSDVVKMHESQATVAGDKLSSTIRRLKNRE